jgi:hypothetical protein
MSKNNGSKPGGHRPNKRNGLGGKVHSLEQRLKAMEKKVHELELKNISLTANVSLVLNGLAALATTVDEWARLLLMAVAYLNRVQGVTLEEMEVHTDEFLAVLKAAGREPSKPDLDLEKPGDLDSQDPTE